MSITCEDWRACAGEDIRPLLDREIAAWRSELGCDVRHAWRLIEPARAGGVLPGFVARDSRGRFSGWTWFLVTDGCLQIGALIAREAETVQALFDHVMASPEARSADAGVCSVRGNPPGLRDVLERYDFDVADYIYQVAPLTPAAGVESIGRAWTPADRHKAASLFQRAYAGNESARPFAPRDRRAEWRHYVATLLDTDACGAFQANASLVVDDEQGGLAAAAMTSTFGPGLSHLVQVAVDPDQRGSRLGRRLVEAAMNAAAHAGSDRISLLVSRGNAAAVRMYTELGFVDCAPFVMASRTQPRRLTSLALATCGVSTRR